MFPKPAKGESRAEKLALRAQIERLEARAKLSAKVRDGYQCRVPGCTTDTTGATLSRAATCTTRAGARCTAAI